MSAGRILVTGASGFLGRHLCAELGDGSGVLRALVRPGGAAIAPGIELAPAPDLQDRDAVRRAMRGVDMVVHLAARVHMMRERASDPLAEFRRTNVEGTRVVLEEAMAAGARRFVFLSSVKAVGEAGETRWTEAAPATPVDPYGISKLEAERLVLRAAEGARLQSLILRLPLVYGPAMRGNMLRLFDLIARGVPLPFGAVRNRRSLAYVGNVVGAIAAVLQPTVTASGVFFVSDNQDLSTPELIRAIGRALGRPVRLVAVPPALLGPLARFSPAVARMVGSLAVDPSALARVAGISPRFTVEEGLDRTARWYLDRPRPTR